MTQDRHLDELAAKLFRVFSRTEFALKASGYNRGDGNAEANWRKFALAVEDAVANPSSPEMSTAIDFIFHAPPQKQVIAEGKLQWRNCKPSTNSRADELLQYVRRVRNNLFHGGKFNARWFSPKRSELLLRHSLVILSECVEAVPLVRRKYHEGQ